mmetsp:Transcript_13510/g.29350  ORF Transcript_13510/g.29350 Transcript_13510/m.29350 type:complete len:219 (-) Transcript_13510:572-1228(-)
MDKRPTGMEITGLAPRRNVIGSGEVGSTRAVDIAAHSRHRSRGTDDPSVVAVLAFFCAVARTAMLPCISPFTLLVLCSLVVLVLVDFAVVSTTRSVSSGIASPQASSFISTGMDHVTLVLGSKLAQLARANGDAVDDATVAALPFPAVTAATQSRANPPIIMVVKLVLAPSTTSGLAKNTNSEATTDGTTHPSAYGIPVICDVMAAPLTTWMVITATI